MIMLTNRSVKVVSVGPNVIGPGLAGYGYDYGQARLNIVLLVGADDFDRSGGGC
jgi:hypothetical protein